VRLFLECGDLSPLLPSRLVGVAIKAVSGASKPYSKTSRAWMLTDPTPTSRLGESGDKSLHSKRKARAWHL